MFISPRVIGTVSSVADVVKPQMYLLPSGSRIVRSDFGRRHRHTARPRRTKSSRHPSKSAGFDLLDFLYTLRRGVEPHADVAVTLSKLRRHVLHRHPGLPGGLQGLDDLSLQWNARSSPFCFSHCEHGSTLFSLSLRPSGLHPRREFGFGCRTHFGLLPMGSAVLHGYGLSADDPFQFPLESVYPF